MSFLRAAVMMLFLPAAVFASPAEDVSARFVDVLRRDDLSLLAQLVDPEQTDRRAWEEFREIVNTYDCTRVDRYETTLVSESADQIALRLRIDGSASLKAAWRPERPLPRWWNIEARRSNGEWRLSRAITEERRVGAAMAVAPSASAAEEILAAARDVNVTSTILAYANELGSVGDFSRFDHAIALARETGDVSAEMLALRSRTLHLLGTDPARALEAARNTVELARAKGSPDDLARALLPFALSHVVNGNRDEAIELYAASAALVELLDDPLTALKALHMEMHVSWYERSVLEIVRGVETLLELSRRFGWEEGYELALFNLANVQSALGNQDVARSYYDTLIPLAEKHGNAKFATFAIYNLAVQDSLEGRFEDAAARLRLLLARPGENWAIADGHELLARTYLRMGRLNEAEESLKRAEASVRPNETRPGLFLTRSNLHLQRGDTAKAIETAREALRTHQLTMARDDLVSQGMLHGALARALRAAGGTDEAIDALRSVISLVETAQEQMGIDALGLASFLEQFAELYVELVELLVARGDIDEAFRVAEQMKSRGLREAISSSYIDLSRSLSEDNRAREKALQGSVVKLNREIFALRQKQQPVAELEQQLAVARRELDAFRSEMRIKHPAVARKRFDAVPSFELPSGDPSLALIEYVVAQEQVIAFVVRHDAPIRAVRMPMSRKILQAEVAELDDLVAARSMEYRSKASHLYAKLVAPLEPHLPKNGTLAIIPDGALWTVPFHALVTSDGRHLIDHRPVFYAHSLHLLRQASALRTSSPSRLLALGNPNIGAKAQSTIRSVFRNTPLASLHDAEVEVRSVSSMYPAGQKRVYTRAAATENAFKNEAPGFNVIHIAAHAIVDNRAPLYSAIVLANASAEEDGLLEAREVVDLPLNADLAVLSACETARGKVGAGEGVIGLSWAFFAAGCPTTVVSQWRAESAATSRLMIEFHRQLRAGKPTAEALRQAQMAVRRTAQYKHPFYWAPFIAVGAAGVNPSPQRP